MIVFAGSAGVVATVGNAGTSRELEQHRPRMRLRQGFVLRGLKVAVVGERYQGWPSMDRRVEAQVRLKLVAVAAVLEEARTHRWVDSSSHRSGLAVDPGGLRTQEVVHI